jgi:carbonic anhydrase/acetyltransferase-like protein (isoleucine patch superfamily)
MRRRLPHRLLLPTRHVIGKVSLHANSSVWFGATLRGDNERITMGETAAMCRKARCCTRTWATRSHGPQCHHRPPGHAARLHHRRRLIGIQAVILNGAKIGKGCLVGAGALVTEGKEFPDNC